jgi:syntaxin 1B/2/3
MEAFYTEVDSISNSLRAFDGIVSRIGQLRDRSFNTLNQESARSLDHEIEQLEKDVRDSMNSLKSRIQALQVQGGSTTDAQTRRDHIQRLNQRLRQSLLTYQQVESEHQKGVRERMKRQLRIGTYLA